jgi:hypothetical protein
VELSTFALLLPAISLPIPASGNRFARPGRRAGQLRPGKAAAPSAFVRAQLPSQRAQIELVKRMQRLGALSFFGCASSMIALLLCQAGLGHRRIAQAIVLLALSLLLSLATILASTRAPSPVLADIEIHGIC